MDDGQVLTADLLGRDLLICPLGDGQQLAQALGPGDGLPYFQQPSQQGPVPPKTGPCCLFRTAVVNGYASAAGRVQHNRQLSENRAWAVARCLEGYG